MIVDKTDGYLDTVRAWAKEHCLLPKLEARLEYLGTYAYKSEEPQKERTRCQLYKDFAPHSFYFVMEVLDKDDTWKRWFNGGLIWHSLGDSGVGSPTYSVRLDNSTEGWEVHT